MASENELITVFREEMQAMRAGLTQISDRLDRNNELLTETRNEIKETRNEIKETRSELSSKLAGISNFLIQSEKSHQKTNSRLDALESRVEKLENHNKPQT